MTKAKATAQAEAEETRRQSMSPKMQEALRSLVHDAARAGVEEALSRRDAEELAREAQAYLAEAEELSEGR